MEPTIQGGGGKPSKTEAIKIASEYLKMYLADEVHNDSSHISEEAASVLKFHGSYQQDNRDERTRLKREGQEKAYQFMVRVRIVGGALTAAQYLTCSSLAEEIGNGTLRITTRQEFQLHGVMKRDLATTIKMINQSLLSTQSACGDVERNVLCCSAPIADRLHAEMHQDALRWASHCAPRASSYWDIWLDGEKIQTLPPAGPSLISRPNDDPVEPIYGKAFLPRKFKSAFTFPDDNCTDVLASDLSFIANVEEGEIAGYNIAVGGGMGTTPSAQKTFPFLSQNVGYIERSKYMEAGEAIIKIFRDFGNRSDRKRARLKYIVHDWGMPVFRAKVEEYLGYKLEDPKPIELTDVDDHLGWHAQGDGKLFLGIPVENGRIKDQGSMRLFSGLRAYFEKYRTPGRLTCQQRILLIDIDPKHKAEIEALLQEYGIASVENYSTVRRWSMACPALPTCGLAVTEAERVLPGIIDELEVELAKIGLDEERFTVRMTGCPNGCARPYNSDVGLVGRSAVKNADGTPGPGTYTIFLGGRTVGDRLNVEYKDYVPYDQIVGELMVVFNRFKAERLPLESFGDYCDRIGVEELAKVPVSVP
jgi:sulfite reductase (ferredoxin)